MELKNYWFALKSHVYVEFKKEKILLYDTKLGHAIETTLNDAIALISQLYEPVNLGVIMINHDLGNTSPSLWAFIQEIRKKEMADLTDIKLIPKKPVRLIPILNLQKDIDKHKDKENKIAFLGKDISRYLLELNIYLNDICDKSCEYCHTYNRQIRYCTTNKNGTELSINNLRNLFEQLRYSSVGNINILGGNVYLYSNLEKLQELLLPCSNILHFYMHYTNYQKHEFIDSQKIELLVNFPVNESVLHSVWMLVNKENTRFHFIVESEQQYHDMERLINLYDIKEYDIHPFFTGDNISFFDKNIFLDKEDIFTKIFKMREIFRNQKLNSNFFGILYILPDGTVKANINTSSLGNLNKDEILNIVYKELIDNTAWRTVRESQPCNECIYQFICPPPSDYERAIGQNNLCHISS